MTTTRPARGIRVDLPRLAGRIALAGLLAAAGCGGRDGASDEGRAATAATATSGSDTTRAGVGTPGKDECPLTGAWRRCSVEDRLERAGLAPQLQPEPVRRAGFAVAGTRYQVGRGTLEVFLFESAAARDRAVAALDSTSASPRGTRGDWPATPTLMGSGNLAAVVYGVRDREVERVALALSAGLPTR